MKKGIAALRHRVVLCRQEDVISGPDRMELNRKAVGSMWAAILPKKASTFSTFGAAMKESRDARTHQILIRYRSDLNLSAMAWLYEERLASSPRWFKILSVGQTEQSGSQYHELDCRLIERSDELVAPKPEDGPVVNLPAGVRL